jgi:hypothetical protein
MILCKWILPSAFDQLLPLENQQYTTTVIHQLTDIPSFPMHIIMALFIPFKIVNAYFKAEIKKYCVDQIFKL